MAQLVRPSTRVAARRRRVFLWAPLLILGYVVSVAGGEMLLIFNGLDLVAVFMLVAGITGFAWDMDQ